LVKEAKLITADGRAIAYWGDVWRHRDLIKFLAWRDILVRYKQTAVGVAWAVLRPLVTLVVYTLVFGRIAQLPSNGLPYTLVVFTGLLPWQLFALVLGAVSESLVTNAALVSKVYFPRIVIPISAIGVCVFDCLISCVLLVLLVVWLGHPLGWQFVLLPLVAMLAALAGLGIGLLAAALNAHYRDFRHVLPIILQLGAFISPVGYLTSLLPEKWQFVYALNPVVGIIDAFRWCVFGTGDVIFPPSVLVTIAFTIVTLWYGLVVFRRMESTFADVI
jgi:homopolymeric O-antigen transport system permease protein